MAIVFYVLGSLIMVLGGLLMVLPLVAAGYAASTYGGYSGYEGAAALGAAVAFVPGFSLLFFGLLMLAVGGVLGRLDKIVNHTREAWRLQYDSYADTTQRQRI